MERDGMIACDRFAVRQENIAGETVFILSLDCDMFDDTQAVSFNSRSELRGAVRLLLSLGFSQETRTAVPVAEPAPTVDPWMAERIPEASGEYQRRAESIRDALTRKHNERNGQ